MWEILKLLCIPKKKSIRVPLSSKNAYTLSRNFHGRRVGRARDLQYIETVLVGKAQTFGGNPGPGAGASSGGLGRECFDCNNNIKMY